ncbi:MAG: ribonuclease HII [Micrococcales bacterium]|nr:ribonuclease HII [Micrococcales bacterium]
MRKPSLRVERELQREGFAVVAGMDEVGRGALAGPVSVGVVVIDQSCRSGPIGLRDSKLLAPRRREQLVAPVRRWALAWGVGHASALEIVAVGILGALRRAGRRALATTGVRPDVVLLDGKHDWLNDPARDGLLAFAESDGPDGGRQKLPPVRTLVKADMRCSSVAGASVLAKVERDAAMVEFARTHSAYGWEINKGYAAPEHRRALLRSGPCVLHRRSWNLTGMPERMSEALTGPAGALRDGADDIGEVAADAGHEWAMMGVPIDVEVIRG